MKHFKQRTELKCNWRGHGHSSSDSICVSLLAVDSLPANNVANTKSHEDRQYVQLQYPQALFLISNTMLPKLHVKMLLKFKVKFLALHWSRCTCPLSDTGYYMRVRPTIAELPAFEMKFRMVLLLLLQFCINSPSPGTLMKTLDFANLPKFRAGRLKALITSLVLLKLSPATTEVT